ncbi:serine hydrolase [Longispora albida]|uniref:serine hydrolase n=1 Tax=Longispora albida TaxID=203523 RepID=UPI00037BEB4B|nr:serine hydrolase [Longispora albida]
MRRTRGLRIAIAALGVAVLAACAPAVSARPADPGPAPGAGSVPAAGPLVSHAEVLVEVDGWASWSLLDLTTGAQAGSPDSAEETNNTESMIKAWIAADYLAGAEGRPLTADEKTMIQNMIWYSDDDAAEVLYQARGADAVIDRLAGECGLTGTYLEHDWWSYTQITAADAAKMMGCVLGRSAYLDELLRTVDPSGRFGIPEALPAGTEVAVKNGWTLQSSDGQWRVNCLASWDHWALAVLTQYPAAYGQDYGAGICRSVTSQLFDGSATLKR